MDTLILMLSVVGALVITTLVGNVLGYFLTEVVHPLINAKPFNCRPCLTFWLVALLGAISGICLFWGLPVYGYLLSYAAICGAVLLGLLSFLFINKNITILK